MTISLFELFSVGIGPSSSHTVGPMRAACAFIEEMKQNNVFDKTHCVVVELYGSLALTGKGHGTDNGVILGLEGNKPEELDPDWGKERIEIIRQEQKIKFAGEKEINFTEKDHIIFYRRKTLDYHANGMILKAFDHKQDLIYEQTYYSIGGGFILSEKEAREKKTPHDGDHNAIQIRGKYEFQSGAELLALAKEHKLRIWEIVLENECRYHDQAEVYQRIDYIWEAMGQCIDKGCQREGHLPGKLQVRRRAKELYDKLVQRPEQSLQDPLTVLDWVNLYAIAVNEENASGNRVVTAPTNGAAGIIPAVVRYYERFSPKSNQKGIRRFFLTATAIGSLYAKNASISGAEVGCQGEVGVACSMAAGGLVAALQGNAMQVEQAAEIAMEHNLGLTCDPIGGLVQIPCIERNAVGAIKAINAARIALRGDGQHYVSLDSVIKTMKETGADMQSKYKETSRGGLAVNVPNC